MKPNSAKISGCDQYDPGVSEDQLCTAVFRVVAPASPVIGIVNATFAIEGGARTTFEFEYENTADPTLMEMTLLECVQSCPLSLTVLYVKYLHDYNDIKVFFGDAESGSVEATKHPDEEHVMLSVQIPQGNNIGLTNVTVRRGSEPDHVLLLHNHFTYIADTAPRCEDVRYICAWCYEPPDFPQYIISMHQHC